MQKYRSKFIRISESPVKSHRRGTVIPLVAICMLMLLGFAALTVDSGRLYVAKNELQNAADSAALAAATAMLSTANQKKDASTVQQDGYSTGLTFSMKHLCDGKSISLNQSQVNFGRLENPNDLKEPFNTGTSNYNAVQVTAQRSNASNGLLDLTFARIWGLMNTSVSASAVAVLDDHMSSYKPLDNANDPGPMIPVTMLGSEWSTEAASGTDEFTYDPVTGQVTPGPDGIPEVEVYPNKQAPGNFGLLNIGQSNNSVNGVGNQIINGVSQADLTKEVGQPELQFVDDMGNTRTFPIGGTPGMKASLENSFKQRLGNVVGIPVNSAVSGNGANSVFTITAIRFGRLMEVNLQGGNKRVVVQPVYYTGGDIITSSNANAPSNAYAPSTNLNASRIHLAR